MADISSIVGTTGVQLEQAAFQKFGAAISTGKPGELGSTISPQNDSVSYKSQPAPGEWNSTNYAAGLASGKGQYDPKLKFLFKIGFTFHNEVAQMAASLLNKTDVDTLSRELSFAIKQIDLPKIEFDYEEVNMYNFRTKVLRSIKNRELNLSFYDDVGNRAINFVNVYMMLFKPISRMEQSPTAKLEDYGFAFPKDYMGLDTSYRGALPGNRKDILSKLTIEQFYVDRAATVGTAVKLNRFIFTNPRITSLDVSDQDHEQGGAYNVISAVFDFDALYIETNKAGKDSKIDPFGDNDIGLNDASGRGTYSDGPAAAPYLASQDSPGRANNQFVNYAANQTRMPSATMSSIQNKSFVGNPPGGAQSNIFQKVSALQDAANRTLQTVNKFAPGINIASVPIIRDANTSISQIQNLATRYLPK